MAKKKQFNYFEALAHLADNAHLAALKLQAIVENYDYDRLPEISEEVHIIERDGDTVVHDVSEELAISFITPIDREDIVLITNSLDDVLDGINELTYLFENLAIYRLRPRTEEFANLVIEGTQALLVATKEFSKFKNSKTLKNLLKEVNKVEANGDRLYSELTKDLYQNEKDAIEIIKWRDIYNNFEHVVNNTEKAVDIIGGLVIKNI
jgi:predicted phosphate transport protein (TIGR00153 family)